MLRGHLYRIVTPYAVGGFTVWGGKIDFAPPIFRWMVGKRFDFILAWARDKKTVRIEDLEKHDD